MLSAFIISVWKRIKSIKLGKDVQEVLLKREFKIVPFQLTSNFHNLLSFIKENKIKCVVDIRGIGSVPVNQSSKKLKEFFSKTNILYFRKRSLSIPKQVYRASRTMDGSKYKYDYEKMRKLYSSQFIRSGYLRDLGHFKGIMKKGYKFCMISNDENVYWIIKIMEKFIQANLVTNVHQKNSYI